MQEPTFEPGRGPVVLIDMGHYNLIGGERYLNPETRLIDDGYVTRTLTEPFTKAVLTGVDVVVIAGALAYENSLRRFGRPAECSPPSDRSAECMAAWNARIAEV